VEAVSPLWEFENLKHFGGQADQTKNEQTNQL
jgi:hypothetical protein